MVKAVLSVPALFFQHFWVPSVFMWSWLPSRASLQYPHFVPYHPFFYV